jgi:uncharacterized glyoxalase superfamily protein PhnB
MNLPQGHQTIMPYLIVDGAEQFVAFIKRVFGAKELTIVHRPDDGGIMHAEYSVGNSTIMLANATEQYHASPSGLFIYVDNADTTFQRALKEGATAVLEPRDQEYGRSGGFKDKFGNTWWVTTPLHN